MKKIRESLIEYFCSMMIKMYRPFDALRYVTEEKLMERYRFLVKKDIEHGYGDFSLDAICYFFPATLRIFRPLYPAYGMLASANQSEPSYRLAGNSMLLMFDGPEECSFLLLYNKGERVVVIEDFTQEFVRENTKFFKQIVILA